MSEWQRQRADYVSANNWIAGGAGAVGVVAWLFFVLPASHPVFALAVAVVATVACAVMTVLAQVAAMGQRGWFTEPD